MIIFQNPLAIALALIGANLSDFDHKMKKMHVVSICLLGALISFVLYHFNYPIYLGIGILSLGVVFLFSSHRGFTHSFLGIIFQSLALCSILFFAFQLLFGLNYFIFDWIGSYNLLNFINLSNVYDVSNLSNFSNLGYFNIKLVDMVIIVFCMAVLFLNKKLLPIVAILLIFSFLGFNNFNISFLGCFSAIFLGLFSHMVLDSFTPSGVRPFIPFSNKKFYKSFGILMIILLAFVFTFVFILTFTNNFNDIFINNCTDILHNFSII